ncbi:uncharacterized protein LOC129896898 isoform X3 [Solanum dulcamara]|uniref:uncharacterized protein LOC129896898 isoform X3 n=1 Tax=Solanum dulcamara TaxID=45834 RepID=UPI002485F283|nr:uncharacterized protein LOC129896898 isoform X3 [Solanum dulcamara]
MKKKEWSFVLGLLGILLQLFLLAESTLTRQNVFKKNSQLDQQSFPPVQLLTLDDYVVVDNGLFNITFSVPGGMVTEIQYNGIDNLLEDGNKDDNRGYWDIVWNKPSEKGIFDKLHATDFKVIMEDENQVELSFTRTWDSLNSKQLSMNIDKRFIILKGISGFYCYGILERLEGWPDIDVYQGRIVFKLNENLFQYMAISDERQRIMPTAHDREMGQILDYSEAVLLTNPNNPFIKGEVDDKYQYSCENKDNRVHGWISPTPRTGFWMITPTDEFRTGGPVKQDLTSHTGPVNLNAYQFWTQTDSEGYFLIKNVIPGNYSLYAWVPGFVGDYMYDPYIIVTPGSRKRVETLIYDAPRNGPTLWEIGIPDRTGAEFFIPDAQPGLLNKLYVVNNQERFRQYGLWDRYTEIYPDDDLVFTVGLSSYQTDWFFAHLNRYFYNDDGNKTYAPTTWQVLFDLEDVDQSSNYTLQLALASAHEAELQVRFNDPETDAPHYTTGLIGKDNAIARHGIHGIYRLYTINVPGSLLGIETNIMYLTQSRGDKPFRGIIYDYIRLEGPSYESN